MGVVFSEKHVAHFSPLMKYKNTQTRLIIVISSAETTLQLDKKFKFHNKDK